MDVVPLATGDVVMEGGRLIPVRHREVNWGV